MDDGAELANLQDSLSEYNQIDQSLQQFDENIGDLDGQIAADPPTKAELEKQRADAQEARQKTAEDKAQKAVEYATGLDAYKGTLAKKLGIEKGQIDFDANYNDWNPKMQDHFANLTDDIVDNVQQVQESVGEKGKTVENSPETQSKLREAFKDPFVWMAFFSGLAGLVNAGLSGDFNSHDYFTKHNTNLSQFRAIGCYQYHTKTGSIRTLGVCGINQECAASTDSKSCAAITPVGICQWDKQNSQCTAGPLVTDAASCCAPCTKDSDCHSIAAKSCKVPSDCLVGDCVNGTCVDQTCNTVSNTCTPCPSVDPKFPVLEELKEGKLGFCMKGFPSTNCPASSRICRATTDNVPGACTACATTDDSCVNPGGISSIGNCLCTGSDWVTVPICGTASTLITNLAYMQAVKNLWAPSKTPLVIYIITGLGILMLVISLIWYVIYLIKHGKK